VEETGSSNPCIWHMQDKHGYGHKKGQLVPGSQSSHETTQHTTASTAVHMVTPAPHANSWQSSSLPMNHYKKLIIK
jgi:hypothetical protein